MEHEITSDKEICFQVLAENKVSWQVQNKIHYLLNKSYDGISISFIAKTYAKSLPQHRILLFMKDELIGHLGLFERYLISDQKKIPFLGMGLFAVNNKYPGYGLCLLKRGLEETRKKGFKFAVGISNNPTVIKTSEILGAKTYKTKLIANDKNITAETKDNDVVLFYPMRNDKELVDLIDNAKINNEFRITGGLIF